MNSEEKNGLSSNTEEKEKQPHGADALRELLTMYDEFGLQPSVTLKSVSPETWSEEFKRRLESAIEECIVDELILLQETVSAVFGEELEVCEHCYIKFCLRYLAVLNLRSKLFSKE